MELSKNERIAKRKQEVGSRLDRRLTNYSEKFNEMFNFFLCSNRVGMITFCGSEVKVKFDPNGLEAKECFRKYENGQFKNHEYIPTRQPNILKSAIIGKKGWGFIVKQWSEGIGSGLFTKYEFLQMVKEYNITIPEPLMVEFNKAMWKERFLREEEQRGFEKMLYGLCGFEYHN